MVDDIQVDMSVESPASTRVNSPAPPISPTTTGNILAARTDLDTTLLRTIAEGLLATIRTREEVRDSTESQLREEIDALRTRLDDYTATYFRPPQGYLPNNGRLPQFTVPTDQDVVQTVRWIRRMSDGRVAGHLQEDGPTDDPYVTELYAGPAPSDSTNPVRPLPQWFRRILVSPSTQYHDLVAAAYALDDWSIHSEILRYRRLDDNIGILQIEAEAIQGDLTAAHRDRRACEMRLEAARAHNHFAHLELARRFAEDRPRASRRVTRRHGPAYFQQNEPEHEDETGRYLGIWTQYRKGV
jgi:hypothetical protein